MRARYGSLGNVIRRTACALWLVAGCAQAGGGSELDDDTASSGGDVDAGARVDAQRPRGNDPVIGPVSGGKGDGGKDCNRVNIAFASPEPTVFILVDRSSSMFEQNFWDPLKAGVLEVVQKLEKEVRFGFSTYTGQAGGMCPDLSSLQQIDKNNYDAIKRAYDSVGKPTYKGETPTASAIEAVTKRLVDEQAGLGDVMMSPTVILLVTDGEPDFCDDPNVTCSRDAVVGAVQAAKKVGVSTFIFSIGGQVDRNHLADVANAGLGQQVVDRNNAVMYQCPMKRGSYGTSAGNAPYFEPDVNDQTALVKAIEGVVSSVRSCVFDLQGRLEIDLDAAEQGQIEIDGERVPFDATDGYRMNSATQLELLGKSCEKLRRPETRRIFIDFPCEAILFL